MKTTNEQVAAGELKGFTGVDAPYEPPVDPEIWLPNYKMSIEECVEVFLSKLRTEGILEGGPLNPQGLPMPDGGEMIDLHIPENQVCIWYLNVRSCYLYVACVCWSFCVLGSGNGYYRYTFLS